MENINNNVLIVMTARCHDEYGTQIRLESPFVYNLSDVEYDFLQPVVDFFENKGITIDQGGDENTLEFDLPDTFDTVSQAQRTAKKIMDKLLKKLHPYVNVLPAPQQSIVSPPTCTGEIDWKKMDEVCISLLKEALGSDFEQKFDEERKKCNEYVEKINNGGGIAVE